MVQIKHFTAPQKMPNFQFSRRAKWPWRDKILGAPQRGQKIIGHVETQTMQTVQTECYFFTCTLIFYKNFYYSFLLPLIIYVNRASPPYVH